WNEATQKMITSERSAQAEHNQFLTLARQTLEDSIRNAKAQFLERAERIFDENMSVVQQAMHGALDQFKSSLESSSVAFDQFVEGANGTFETLTDQTKQQARLTQKDLPKGFFALQDQVLADGAQYQKQQRMLLNGLESKLESNQSR